MKTYSRTITIGVPDDTDSNNLEQIFKDVLSGNDGNGPSVRAYESLWSDPVMGYIKHDDPPTEHIVPDDEEGEYINKLIEWEEVASHLIGLDLAVESFDDISEIHQEIQGYNFCIRVFFETEMPEVEDLQDEIQLAYEHAALIKVFGDLAPKDLMCDWRDEQELWIRYNIGESESTLP